MNTNETKVLLRDVKEFIDLTVALNAIIAPIITRAIEYNLISPVEQAELETHIAAWNAWSERCR